MLAQSGLSLGFELFLEKGGMGRGGGAKSGASGDRTRRWSPRRPEGAWGGGCFSFYRTKAFEDFG